MRSVWRTIVAWFETGDLVPLMVLVSAVHYAAVLAGRDLWPVAIAIGLLVDLGHYRTVRAAVRYNGRTTQTIARWCAVCVMTAVSLAYHQRYYGDWWLSAPLPLLIAFLAWQSHVDARIGKRSETQSQPAQTQAPPAQTQAPQPVRIEPEPMRYVCVSCGAGYERQQSLAAHMRKHTAVRRNGKHVERVV